MNLYRILNISAFVIFFTSLLAAQPVQWRGPERNGHYPSTGLLQEWPEEGPELIAKFENLNVGYSSPLWYNNART